MRLAILALLAACSSGTRAPDKVTPPPNTLGAVDWTNGKASAPPERCKQCPSGECMIEFKAWCASTAKQAGQRDWWTCAPSRDALREDGCPARTPSGQPCPTDGRRCVYYRCPETKSFEDVATCTSGQWAVMSED